ncbi:MAG TPA: beta-ketoacyl-[acyl-carrier-protein] synthase family protein, partial [Candidatus Limnocylindrales bacterium]|nr:beta-ketoacyl-[acyl-carrier-protein] synthase family protein [Candidatus Limnocylindrales bacterium]
DAAPDAGVDRNRCGVILGVGLNGMDAYHREFQRYLAGESLHPLFLPLAMPNAAAANLALRLGWFGPAVVVNTACASSANALGDAARLIADGELDLALAGGAETPLNGLILTAFAGLGALSPGNGAPHNACRPFDRDRDGFVMGEGAACCVLERLSSARRRNVRPYALLVGYGRGGDAHHLVAPRPDGEKARWCMAEALRDACLAPQDISHINTHGTATKANDLAEAKAIHALFGDTPPPVTAVKGTIGHLIGASGAAEAVASILTLRHGHIPPTANYVTPDPECAIDVVAGPGRPLAPGAVLSNSFAFGGHNAALVFASAGED